MRKYVGVLDGVLDFEFQRLARLYIAKNGWMRPEGRLISKLLSHYAEYPGDFFLPSFLDNHDMNRFLFESRQDKARLRRAATVQFEQRKPPIIYYGTEAGLTHDRPVDLAVDFSDAEARLPMPWDDMDTDLLAHFKQLIKRRRLRTQEQR